MTDIEADEEARAIGGRLKAAREASGLSQEAIAAVIGIPRTAVSDVERGTRQVSAIELGRFAGRYGTSLEALLYGDAQPFAIPWAPAAVFSSGRWRRLPKLAENLLEAHPDAYERDGREAIDISDGPSDAGTPHLGVWLRADEHGFRDLPLFEVQFLAGSLDVLVYAQTHGDVLYLLRELSPLVKDLHLAQLAGQLVAADRAIDAASAILKAAGR